MATESISQIKGNLYGESVASLQEKAIDHMMQWNPKLHKALLRSNELQPLTLKTAQRAHRQINDLMASGLQRHEAEEMVLPETILTTPEPEVIARIEADQD